jgi:hypothetical protein
MKNPQSLIYVLVPMYGYEGVRLPPIDMVLREQHSREEAIFRG